MQDQPSINKQVIFKDSPSSKDFYSQSVLKQNIINDLCNDITINETIDINLEKVYNYSYSS
jgi:hypothetical protein